MKEVSNASPAGSPLIERPKTSWHAGWEQTLIAAVTLAAGGENPIQNIDHEAKVIEIKAANKDAVLVPFMISMILYLRRAGLLDQ